MLTINLDLILKLITFNKRDPSKRRGCVHLMQTTPNLEHSTAKKEEEEYDNDKRGLEDEEGG